MCAQPLRLAVGAVVVMCLAGASPAQVAQVDESLTIPVRLVNGRLIVLTDLVGLQYTNEASFEISFEYPDALTLHHDQYDWLGFDPNDAGQRDRAVIKLLIEPRTTLEIPAREVVEETSAERVAFQNAMTKLYSSELGERKVKGTIGVGLLKKYHVTLDMPAKQLMLAPPIETDDPMSMSVSSDAIVAPFEYRDNRMLVQVQYADNRIGRLVVGGTAFDTTIDAGVAESIGKPAGDVSPVWLVDGENPGKQLDLSRYVAFRPEWPAASPAENSDAPLIVAGWNLLLPFRVDVDWVRHRLTLTQRQPPSYPIEDFEFFHARSLGTSEALVAYLEKYPAERLSRDAAALLVQWRLEKDSASDADVLKALDWAVKTSLPGRRTETCLSYLETFGKIPGRTRLAIAAGREGLRHAREAFDARAVYGLHNELGELYFADGALNDAWKHFLSAAFMAPEDLDIALNLARVYDRQGEVRRAYARYKKVAAAPALPPEIATEVRDAMDRLRNQLPKDDPLLRTEDAGGRGGPGTEP